jgi:hypothetical protein
MAIIYVTVCSRTRLSFAHKFLIFYYTHSRSWIIILGPSWTMLHRRLFILVLTNREPGSDQYKRIPYPRLEPPDSHIPTTLSVVFSTVQNVCYQTMHQEPSGLISMPSGSLLLPGSRACQLDRPDGSIVAIVNHLFRRINKQKS